MKFHGLRISIHHHTENDIEFDLTGYDVTFANALRRILLADHPMMAIERVKLYQNTTVMHDEFLGHRLGLIPIKVDANLFDYFDETNGDNGGGEDGDSAVSSTQPNERNTIIFSLNVYNPSKATTNLHVYSKDLCWVPINDQQAEQFPSGIRPVDEDILVAKLAPSQRIEAQLHCHKGVGKDHAKYSPVSACYYRHLTTFTLDGFDGPDGPLTSEEVQMLKTCFPKGHLRFSENNDQDQVEVINNRLQTSSELTFMSCPSLQNKVHITTSDSVLAFVVESIGILPANDLVLNGIDILRNKCHRFKKLVLKARKRST